MLQDIAIDKYYYQDIQIKKKSQATYGRCYLLAHSTAIPLSLFLLVPQ